MPELATALGTLIAAGRRATAAAGVPEPRREAIRIWADLGSGTQRPRLLLARDVDGRPVDRRAVSAGHRAARPGRAARPCDWLGAGFGTSRSERCAGADSPARDRGTGRAAACSESAAAGWRDIGTGSGCIALSLALEGGFTEVIGVDRSAEALALARVNRASGRLPGRAWSKDDLCAPLRPGALDALISNPPYLTEAEYIGTRPVGAGLGAGSRW